MARKPKTKSGKRDKMATVMGEYKRGTLHSGSKKGPKVKSRKQAIAIGMKQSGQSRDNPGSGNPGRGMAHRGPPGSGKKPTHRGPRQQQALMKRLSGVPL